MPTSPVPARKNKHFRRFTLRGLAAVLPPLVTVLILVWFAGTVNEYLLQPINAGVHLVVARSIMDVRTADDLVPPPDDFPRPPDGRLQIRLTPQLARRWDERLPAEHPLDADAAWDRVLEQHGDAVFVRLDPAIRPAVDPLAHRPYIPLSVYRTVVANVPPQDLPQTAIGYYEAYIDYGYLGRFGTYVLSFIGLVVVLAAIYFVGRFLTLRLGRAMWESVERGIFHVPLVRSVYSAVKQVTDFLISERDLAFKRVVAVEYPRRGTWALAFVMGEGLRDLEKAAGEPMLVLLVPTSPAPFTGFTVVVGRSETVDLDMSVEHAVQFIVSCGVVVPPQQMTDLARKSQPPHAQAKPLPEAAAANPANTPALGQPSDRDTAS